MLIDQGIRMYFRNRTRLYNAMKEVARLKDQIIQLKEKVRMIV